jgi:PAS domain S-box-containing protein
MNLPFRNIPVITGVILLAALVYLADFFKPADAAIAVLYVIPMLLTLFHPGRKISVLTAIGCIMLTVANFLLSEMSTIHVLNVLISVTGLLTALFFILEYKTRSYTDVRNRERLRALFDHATEGIIIASRKGEILMANPMAEKQFRYGKDELIGKQVEVLVPEKYSQRHVRHRESYAKNPYPRPMGKESQLFARRKDQSEFPVEISLSNFTTTEGSFVIAFIIDISERKKSEEEVRKEKELAQMYLDIAPVIFLVLDKDQTVTLINQNGCIILELNESEILGKNWFDHFVTAEQKEPSRKWFNQLMDGTISTIDAFENIIVTSKGDKRLISWKASIIRDEKGNPMATLGAGEDITERKSQETIIQQANLELQRYSREILQLNADLERRVQARTEELAELIHRLEKINNELAEEIRERTLAEAELEKNREELNQALNKEKELSELKSRFVTMASHEFRTPLSTILSSVSLIAKYNDPGTEEKRFRHVERIRSAVNNLTSILNDFLSLGKLEEGKVQCSPVEFNIIAFSNEVVNELREVTKKDQVIRYTHTGTDTRAFLDKNLTKNICINLISNAIKYSGESASIGFETKTENNQLEIRITDEGIGIPVEEQQHIFERFFRANNASNIQGTGLGLNIVKKYAELMNGEVGFTSVPGTGTTFFVNLPQDLRNGISPE